MSLDRNAQVRDDLNTADKVVRACWDNFIKTEPTYVLRDLIVIEIAKAREAERERLHRLVRDLDVALNGAGAAPQASLCDIVSQVKGEGIKSVNFKPTTTTT